MPKLLLNVITPERTVLSEEADIVSCPTEAGIISILPHHADLISNITSGELIVKNGSNTHNIHVAGGFLQVKEGKEVIILADEAEHYHEIDIEAAQKAKLEAQKTLSEQTLSDEEYATVARNIQKSTNRMTIARKHAHRRQNLMTLENTPRTT